MKLDQKPIVMFTTMHTANDHRIYYKEARSLNKKYPVVVVAPLRNNGRVTDMPHKRISYIPNRLLRFITNIRHIPTLWKIKPRVVHIHDPELLPIALLIKLITRAKIIYDAHENQHLDILQKDWLAAPLRKVILSLYRALEYIVLKNSDGIILAEDSFIHTYKNYKNVEIIRNYPIVDVPYKPDEAVPVSPDIIRLGYIGSVQRIRGALEMLHAVASIKNTFGRKTHLDIIGAFENDDLRREAEQLITSLDIEDCVQLHGILPHESAMKLLKKVHIGFALFHPLPTLERILPVKLYEYMIMSKPIVASDIHLWHSVIGESNCGIFVDPFDAKQIAQAIVSLYENPSQIEKMGRNGFTAVMETFNWESQERLLFDFYERII